MAVVAERISEEALTARSGPNDFCKSPIASIRAKRALLCAVAIAAPCAVERNEIADKLNKPTATTVNRIISESVMTKAKPLERLESGCVFMIGFQIATSDLFYGLVSLFSGLGGV